MACYQNLLGIFPNFFDFELPCVSLLRIADSEGRRQYALRSFLFGKETLNGEHSVAFNKSIFIARFADILVKADEHQVNETGRILGLDQEALRQTIALGCYRMKTLSVSYYRLTFTTGEPFALYSDCRNLL